MTSQKDTLGVGVAAAEFNVIVWLDRDGRPRHQNSTKSTIRGLPINLASEALEEAIAALIAEYDAMIWHHFLRPEERKRSPPRTREQVLQFLQFTVQKEPADVG